MNAVELFSIEAWFVGAFGIILGLMSVVQLFCARLPSLERVNNKFEKFIDYSHAYCNVFPYLFVALLIAVISPVYDVLLDSAWLINRGDAAPTFNDLIGAWRYLLTEGSDVNSQRDLTHALQWMIALGMFWFYSIVWSYFSVTLEHDHGDPTIKFKRAALFGSFGALMGFVSQFLSFLGQHASEILMFS